MGYVVVYIGERSKTAKHTGLLTRSTRGSDTTYIGSRSVVLVTKYAVKCTKAHYPGGIRPFSTPGVESDFRFLALILCASSYFVVVLGMFMVNGSKL